jgi:hypothetical protein
MLKWFEKGQEVQRIGVDRNSHTQGSGRLGAGGWFLRYLKAIKRVIVDGDIAFETVRRALKGYLGGSSIRVGLY